MLEPSDAGTCLLLMPENFAPQWWSPVMPASFFLSSIAAGTALFILIEMWIAKTWTRLLRIVRLSSMGAITFWSLLTCLVFRLVDMPLTMVGFVVKRANAALFAINLRGPMPQIAPSTYSSSIFEWGVSVSLVAATIFLFGLGACRFSPKKWPTKDY
jgi:formate dehydrogenase iron-sulfur subunit